MTDTRKVQLETSLDTRPVKQGFQEIVQAAEGSAAGVQNASAKAGKAVDAIGAGADASARKIENAEKSIIASIQRRTAAVQAAGQSESKYYEALAQQRGVNTDALRPYLQQLDAAKARQDAATASLGNMGMSAKATAAALRGVPAQFTDIVTSLASGQQPLTVLLQQGGQLKDVFGGVGNAARALGGYVVGLINPLTIAGGAVAAIGTAAFQGAGELQAFNKTLILSGGQAGVSGDRLMAMAAGIDALSGSITQSRAAETLDEIVKAGVRGEAQIKRYAIAAAEFETAGGGAATEVAKAFADLGKDPLQASVKLTQSMGYLTASTYEQIKALEDQGRTLEAARVAQDAYASALENRAPALLQNLGLIERGWYAVKNTAKEAWDAMLNVGRPDTLADQAAAVEQRLAAARANPLRGGGFGNAQGRKRQADDEALLSSIKEQQRLADRAAASAADRTAREKERIAFLGQADKFLTSEQRQQREILGVQNLVTRQVITQEEAEKRIAAIRANGAKAPRASRSREGDPFASERSAAKEWADYLARFSDLTLQAEGRTLGLSKAQQELVKYLQSPAYQNASEPMRQLALQQAYVAIGAEQTAEALKREQAAIEASVNALANRIEGQQGRAAEIKEQVLLQVEATAAYGLSGAALLQLEAARLLDAAAERERQAVIADGVDLSGALSQSYRDEATALRDLAAAKQNDAAVRKQKDAYRDLWQGVEGFAESAFMDVALNGESAFKRIGESIKREILQALYEMTVKKWIVNIAAQYGGVGGIGGSGTNWLDMAQQAYSAYSGGGSAGVAIAAGAGTVNTTTLSGISAASAGSTGVAGGTTSAAASGSAAGASTGAWMTAAWYAAVIVAAVAVAENLYSKGYNRKALGAGGSETVRFGQYSSYTTDPRIQKSQFYDIGILNLEAKNQRALQDALGFSEKWADILSGTTRMATLIGRKLGAYGFEADIAGGDADVSGFARYKGGLFRSNKTVGVDIDQRDAAAFDAIVESTIEGARSMAKAMGYSSEAIDSYTGSIRVNMKGAETAEEQSKRMAEAMDELQFSLLKAASGGKYSRQEFEKMMEGVRASIEAAGISTQGIAEILVQGMTGRLSQADVGAQLSEVIIGGIYNSIASNYAGLIAQAFTQQIITPIFTALAAGVPISQAISQSAIQNVVATAQAAAQALNAIFSSAEFLSAIGGIEDVIENVAGAATSVRAPSFRAPTFRPANTAASDAAREKEQLERELLRLQNNTVELRRRELLDLAPGNRALQQRIWMLEDEQEITQERNDLERQRMEVLEDTAGLRKLERDALDQSNRALYDEIQALKEVAELKNVWRDLTDSIEQEVKRIRGDVLGSGTEGLAYVQAQFLTATAQARALDQNAAGLLPDLAGRLTDLYETNAGSRSEFEFQVNSLLSSLEETNRITRGRTGVNESTSAVEDKALAKKVELLQASIDALNATMERNTAAAQTSADALKKASVGGAIRTIPA